MDRNAIRKKEIAGFNNFFVDLPGLVEAAVNGIRVGLADYFQNLADAFRPEEGK